MGIAIAEEHLALERSVRRFVTDRIPPAVVRAALESDDERLPPFWSQMAELGWLGLHLAEADGGQGYGLIELAVVVEGLGRAAAPGPFVPHVVAAAAIAAGAPPGPARAGLLGPLATGRMVAAIACGPAPGPGGPGLRASVGPGGGPWRIDGELGPVLGAGLADVVVAPVRVGDDERWCVLRAGELTVTPVGSLDPTRRVARVAVTGAAVGADRQLPHLERGRVTALAATVFAAEAAGGGGWCVDTAAAYATTRVQFGRPIGQFQGVKHRCADMLVTVEQIRGAAWDAALALDAAHRTGGDGGDGRDDRDDAAARAAEAQLAAAVAGVLGPDGFVTVAEDCIQVLGGLGFTWEHDAHLYLRRAVSVRQLLPSPAEARRWAAGEALAGTRRRLRVDVPEAAGAVRAEVRAFAASLSGLAGDEQRRRLVEAGYFVPHWPAPWGRGAGPAEQLVIDEELRAAHLRRPHLAVGAWAAPTIVAHGTPEQQDRWVGPTLLGTISWCQLFSEPGAGSDLAALTTAATPAPGGWRLNGQKVWTSLAKEADWGICLARTRRDGPRQLGITYFVVDMRSRGIEIRPLREMTGLAMFNEVFFTDVFVPDDAVIGPVDGGWPLARTTLANERVAMGRGSSFGGGLEAVLSLVDGHDPLVVDRLGALVAEGQSVSLLGLRATHRSLAGTRPGPEASVRKLLGAEHDQRTQEFGLGLLGADGATTVGAGATWTFGFLANRCLTIAGGTSEVQRNVIAERLLGLPRDP